MLNRSASLAMSTSVLKALPGKLDIKRHSPSILYTPGRQTKQSSQLSRPIKRIAKLEWTQELFNSHGSLLTIARTSDSLNERLPIKMAREKFQRNRYFSMKMIVGSTLILTAKVFFS